MTPSTTNLQVLAPDEKAQPRSTLSVWGPIWVLLALAVLALALIWLKGDLVHVPTSDAKKTASIGVLLTFIALLLLHLGAFIVGGYRVAGWLFRRETRSADATSPSPDTSVSQSPPLEALRHALQAQHRWRWRYRQPWLLLTGHDKAIERLLPELTEHGYLITDDAVLLLHATDAYGQPDDAWLTQLYRLRRRRPVDGLVLIVDGDEETSASSRVMHGFGIKLARIAHTLHWSAPIYVLDVAKVDEIRDGATPMAGCEVAPNSAASSVEADLLTLRDQLAQLGVQRLSAHPGDRYIAELSQRLDGRAASLAAWIAGFAARRLSVRGVFFTPFPAKSVEGTDASGLLPAVWSHLSHLARRHRGRRVGWHPITVCSAIVLALVGVWTGGMLISAFANAHDLHRSQQVGQALDKGDDAAHLRALLALQQRIGMYEERVQHHAPGVRGFGLNRDRDTLDALWTRYATASRALLTTPVQLSLESSLTALGKARADALQDRDAQHRHYNRLKAYLMLADPARADPDFLAQQIASVWPTITTLPPGEWQDSSQRLASFFARHLKAHPDWRIQTSASLVTTARSALVNQIGLANADDTIYQSILDSVRGKYADLSLPALLHGADAQGLFTTATTVPGIYTRAAWNGMISEAIDKAASERTVESDWVLTGGAAIPPPSGEASRNDLQQRLTTRYFADYAAAWQHMLNSIQWQPATNLTTAIDQLTRLTDAQTSPLIALMKAVRNQAQAGRPSHARGETLVRRAQGLLGRDASPTGPVVHPLDQAFGPLLALMGDSGAVAGSGAANANGNAPSTLNGVSLQSYLTAATTMRLKLQQIGNSPDAQTMARSLAQAVFQGKLSDLAEVREEAALTAASLGSAWAGFGDALFTRPLDGAWQTILQPAAASLNDLWRAGIAAPFNSAFDGRYPFYDTQADASFAELGRYVLPTSGLINRFLTVELAGVLSQQGDQWTPNGLAPQTLAFDPAFLKAVQQMSLLGARLYAQGDAGYHFEIMAQPTPTVTRSELTIDKHPIVYFNQQETWTPIAWPGDGLNGHTALTWQTLDAGVRQAFDGTGDWAVLRLLAKADVKPLDSTRYELTWKQPEAEALRYVIRTQVGAGPLDLLKLRGFKLPERIFMVGRNGAMPVMPPLPPELTSP